MIPRSCFILCTFLLACGPVTPGATAQTATQLAEALPAACQRAEREGKLFVQGSTGTEFEVIGLSELDEAILSTQGGEVPVLLTMLADERRNVVDELATLLEVAKAGGVLRVGLRMEDSPLLGFHLASFSSLVLPEGVLSLDENPWLDAQEDLDKLEAAGVALASVIAGYEDLTPLARRSIVKVIELLPRLQADNRYLTPDHARRLVASGWLRLSLPSSPELIALETANQTCLAAKPVQSFTAEGMSVSWLVDDFEGTCLELRTPTRRGYERQLAAPDQAADPQPLTLVVELPADTDESTADQAIGARVYSPQGTLLAWWTAKDGFGCDEPAWRKVIPHQEGLVTGFLPPHVLVVSPAGKPERLITAHGSLAPVADSSEAEVQRFVSDAARALPDAAHLDLIGELLFLYVMDSPDPERPMLVGNDDAVGEIHQTVMQTLATTTWGICRGDCDDLAELYHAIASEQGRLPHIMAIPGHNALCWAEEGEDGTWTIPVLQTGPPLEFRSDSLPKALESAYAHFLGGQPFDPSSVGLSLRFSGENRRATWFLSHRIFTEPDYAKTMIEVQRCWHLHTFQRGISAMKKLIEAGDHDEANYAELAGLTSATGQWAEHARYMRETVDRGGDPTLNTTIRLIAALYEAEQDEDALRTARSLLGRMNKQRKQLEDRYYELALSLAGVLITEGKESKLSMRLLEGEVIEYVQFLIRQISKWMESPQFSENVWQSDPSVMRIRQTILGYVMLATQCLDTEEIHSKLDEGTITKLQQPIGAWLRQMAFSHPSGPGQPMIQFGILGNYLRVTMGEEKLLALVERAEFPKLEDLASAREGGRQLTADARWIKTSVPFWSALRSWGFREGVTSLDRERFLKICDNLKAAHAATGALGLEALPFDQTLATTELIRALVNEDASALRKRFRDITRIDDKGLRDEAVSWIGGAARFLDPDWFETALAIWSEEVGTRPSYLGIAWSAAMNDAPVHAKIAAEFAVRTYPDESAFAEELKFLEELLDERAQQRRNEEEKSKQDGEEEEKEKSPEEED